MSLLLIAVSACDSVTTAEEQRVLIATKGLNVQADSAVQPIVYVWNLGSTYRVPPDPINGRPPEPIGWEVRDTTNLVRLGDWFRGVEATGSWVTASYGGRSDSTYISVNASAFSGSAPTIGIGHACAMRADGGVSCWGDNWFGSVGTGSARRHEAFHSPPSRSIVPTEVSVIAAGGRHSCALSQQRVLCWGDNNHGKVGAATGETASAPIDVGLASATAVAAGSHHTCAVSSERLYCWGWNHRGQLGGNLPLGAEVHRPTFVDSGYVSVAAGAAHTCAVTTDARIHCWGWNEQGQLGAPGTEATHSFPATVTSVKAGARHTCATTSGGHLYCWGDNANGQAAPGNASASIGVPTRVAFEGTFYAVAPGGAHTCGLTDEGAMCWGGNVYGQSAAIEQGITVGMTLVSLPFAPVQIAAGADASCASDGRSIICWGWNLKGLLGNGALDYTSPPTYVVQGAEES